MVIYVHDDHIINKICKPHMWLCKYIDTRRDRVLTYSQELEVVNQSTSDTVFKFTAALHSYFRVSDISQASVNGLSGLKYLDNMKNRQQGNDEQQKVNVNGEIDRIYVQAPDTIKVCQSAI